MSDASARWTKHRPIAHGIAAEYFLRGADREDVTQEALVALWEACRCYESSKGAFPAFARLVIHRRLRDRVKVTNRHYEPPTELVDDIPATELDESREEVRAIVGAFDQLTDRERSCVVASINGEQLERRDHHALYRARQKLRLAVA